MKKSIIALAVTLLFSSLSMACALQKMSKQTGINNKSTNYYQIALAKASAKKQSGSARSSL